MDLDAALLGKAIAERNLQLLLKSRITADYLYDLEYRALYSYLIEHSNKYGEVPSEELVYEVFPDIKLEEPPDSLEAIVERVRYRRVHNELANFVSTVAEEGQEDAIGAASRAQPKLASLMTLVNDNLSDVDITADTEEVWLRYQRAKSGRLSALSYPWPSLQAATLGIHPENLIFIYGREKTMKTWLLQIICHHIHTVQRKRPLFVSQEMSTLEVQQRAVALFSRVDYRLFREGKLPTKIERDFRDNLEQWRESEPFLVTEVPKRGDEALALFEAKCVEYQADIAFFDGVYLAADTWEDVVKLTRGLKRLAKKLKIPIIGTCQENAQGQTAYSKSFAQDCDMLLRTVRGEPEKQNHEVKVLVPAIREASFGGFTINAFPAYNMSEKHSEEAEDARNNNFEDT